VPLADFGNRLLAYLIDVAIITGVTLVVAVPAVLVFFLVAAPAAADDVNADGTLPPDFFGRFVVAAILLQLGLLLFVLAAYYVYTVEMAWRTGQTVGKRVMKLRVVPLDPRRQLTRGMATKRWAVQFVLGTVVPLFNYLDGFWQLWDKPYLQTLHDKAAQTVVVKVSA
jgi:uncharacterized RDD family membrane protein YckC